MTNIKLSKPILINDKEVNEITLDFESLKGRDVIKAEAEARLMGANFITPEINKTYQAVLVAKALKINAEDVLDMPIKDFTAVTMVAANFLMYGESKPEENLETN